MLAIAKIHQDSASAIQPSSRAERSSLETGAVSHSRQFAPGIVLPTPQSHLTLPSRIQMGGNPNPMQDSKELDQALRAAQEAPDSGPVSLRAWL